MPFERYQKSTAHLLRAERTIPIGSQTFSKSRTQYPVGVSPLYIDRAKGSLSWDLDGNEYVDLVNSLAAVTLGYGDDQVDEAVRKQLEKGVIFSLPGVLEAEVAELLVGMVPSAEMVRFGKNGSDATSAAIRLARAYTGKDHVVVCGYHGWQDWYIGSTTRDKGVPKAVSELTHRFEYNNLQSLSAVIDEYPNQIAAVIMEPMNSRWPDEGFLTGVREIASRANAVLIFDETITGFRYSRGGAQEFFGVTPDLSTFGKGMANGFPISAVVGKREIMMEMEEIFFSGTFGGELLSLAAAKTVLTRHRTQDICGQLSEIGGNLSAQVTKTIIETKLEDHLHLSGHPSWTFLNWRDSPGAGIDEIRTYFMQEMFKAGVLILGTHNVSAALTKENIDHVVGAYGATLSSLSDCLKNGTLIERLKVEPIRPLFVVR